MRRLAWLLAPAVTALGAAACGPGDDDGGACSGLLPGDLVITEVLADYDAPPGGSGADEGHEWFELYNASSQPIELAGVVVTHARPDGTSPKRHVMTAVTIAANQYLVLGNVLPDALPAHVGYGYAGALGDLYNTDGGKLQLFCGSTLVDEALYEVPDAGHSFSLDGKRAPDYQANDDAASWCGADDSAEYEYEPSNFGTPGGANQDCNVVVAGQCDDNGTMRPTVPPQPGDLTITEVMPSPGGVSDTVGEWFEVLVNRDVDLNGLGLDRTGDSSNPVVINASTCRRVTAGSYLVFARNADAAMNGGLPAVAGTFTFSLVPGSVASPGDVRLVMGDVELDALAWTSSRSARSLQLDAGLTAPTDNDTAGNLCDGTTTYGTGMPQDRGTPGAANLDCGAMASTMCLDPGTMQMRAIVKPTAGQLVLSEWMPDPALVADASGEWFEVRATAAVDLNGLQAGTTSLGAAPLVPAGGPCLRLDPAGDPYAVFARNLSTMTNGSVPADATFGFGLTNSNGTLQIGVDGAMLDQKTWTESTPTTAAPCSAAAPCGRSIMLDSDGTQCKAPIGAGGVAPYNGRDHGTPGVVNSPPECP